MKEILFLGNVPTSDPKSIGGATVYTQNLLEILALNDEINIKQLKTRNCWGKLGQIPDFILLILKFPFYLKEKEIVSVHASWDFHVTIGPFIYIISKLFKKKIVYHFFGGNFHKQFDCFPRVLQWWLKTTILSSDYILMETKKMIEYFENHGITDKCIWFPNSRKANKEELTILNYSRRFVFISRVTKTKGINLLFEAVKVLPKDFVIDVYGPIDLIYFSEESFNNSRLDYRGVLKSHEVNKTLSNYDVVILPTYYQGEGYPGILIEAMSLGKPIITTKLNALDEIVIHKYNGLLIRQKSVQELIDAILYFNNENYPSFVKNSLNNFSEFNIERVTEKLIKIYVE
ncbi:glycosyltransferase family 4 protein [Arenibacter sp. 6A1]|uniref:glycosyltransferase family 4 protein n=1 Tax=Arenibacter sp. 6A1 TaxID=2720391 RepID=UPI001447E39E|nr:glycosyltransferase family 4 protein [Arenibacter sp. 6A1]NKI26850.1 glycosyltransferase family 4 protein [Arenibacter sp. 6A1]